MTVTIAPGTDRSVRPAPKASATLAHALAILALVTGGFTATARIVLGLANPTSDPPIVLQVVVTLLVAWILAWKRPAISLGWLLLGLTLFETFTGPVLAVGVAIRSSAPEATRWAFVYGGLNYWTWIPVLGLLLTQVPLRFPTGRLPSRRWRWFSRFTVVALVVASAIASTSEDKRTGLGLGVSNPLHVGWPDGGTAVISVALVLLTTAFVGSIASLFVRYRRSGPVEAAQLRWFFWAVSIVVGLLVVGWIENAIFGGDDAKGVPGFVANALDTVTGFSYLLIPVAILFAVLRSGLYAIDRIISRTAAYAIVTLGVTGVYLGIVLLGGLLIPHAEGIEVAVGTLVAAAVCLPLLRVVRRAVDRRFDRARYDAQRVVERFGERIRTGADPHAAGDDLVASVQVALQPASLGIWLSADHQ